MLTQLIETRIPYVDESLGGGFKPGSVVAFWSEVEVEASALALQAFFNRINAGDDAIFVTTNKKPRQVLDLMDDLGFQIAESKVRFLDFYSTRSLKPDEDAGHPAGSLSNADKLLTEISTALKSTLEANGGETNVILVMDSLSSYIDHLEEPERAPELISNISNVLTKFNATGIFVFTEWPYERTLLDAIRGRFDVIIELNATPQRPIYALRVISSGKELSSSRLTFFKVQKPGGAKIYLPKIVVTGPFHAGKTSFIHSASHGATSADRLGTTVALDYGHANHKGFAIDLFGTPGQERFDPILDKLGGQALGIIVLVSATDPRSIARVRDQMKLINSGGLPFVVAVNKVDLRGAISLEAVKNLMGIKRGVPLIPLRAKNLSEIRPGRPCELNPSDIEKILDQIIRRILEKELRDDLKKN